MRTCRRSETHKGDHENSAFTSSFLHLPPHILNSVIFCCSQATIAECFENLIFGLPRSHLAYVQNVKPGMPVFLYNCSDRQMHGVFEAVSCGQMNINPHGWTKGTEKTPYSAQVRVKVIQLYPSLPESIFKEAVFANYYNDRHFYFELDSTQTSKLWGLFFESLSQKVMVSQNVSTCNKAILLHEEGESEQWHRTTRSVMHAWNTALPYLPEASEATSDVWEGLSGSDGDNGPYVPGPAGFSNCHEWIDAVKHFPVQRPYNQPVKSLVNPSSQLNLGPFYMDKEHEESQYWKWEHGMLQQLTQHPDGGLGVLFSESRAPNNDHSAMDLPVVQESPAYEWTHSQHPFSLSSCQTMDSSHGDKEPDETEWENGMLQQQKQQPEARLNVAFPKPHLSSPDIDEQRIAQLSNDLQYLQTLLRQRGSQESMDVPAVQRSDIQEMADAWEHKELAEKRSLGEQAELIKQRGSLCVREFSIDNVVQEQDELPTSEVVEQMRQHRSELKQLVEEICTELGYFKEVDQLRQRNAVLEYLQTEMASEFEILKYQMQRMVYQLRAIMQHS